MSIHHINFPFLYQYDYVPLGKRKIIDGIALDHIPLIIQEAEHVRILIEMEQEEGVFNIKRQYVDYNGETYRKLYLKYKKDFLDIEYLKKTCENFTKNPFTEIEDMKEVLSFFFINNLEAYKLDETKFQFDFDNVKQYINDNKEFRKNNILKQMKKYSFDNLIIHNNDIYIKEELPELIVECINPSDKNKIFIGHLETHINSSYKKKEDYYYIKSFPLIMMDYVFKSFCTNKNYDLKKNFSIKITGELPETNWEQYLSILTSVLPKPTSFWGLHEKDKDFILKYSDTILEAQNMIKNGVTFDNLDFIIEKYTQFFKFLEQNDDDMKYMIQLGLNHILKNKDFFFQNMEDYYNNDCNNFLESKSDTPYSSRKLYIGKTDNSEHTFKM